MLVVVQFVLLLLALSRDINKSLIRSSMWLCSLIWPDSMSDTSDCSFSYCLFEILGMCYCSILFFTNALQLTSQLIFSPQHFYILRAFTINNPDVFWYHLFELLDFLFGFLFLNTCAHLCCNCINIYLQMMHFRNGNIILWRQDLCLILQTFHTTFNSFQLFC